MKENKKSRWAVAVANLQPFVKKNFKQENGLFWTAYLGLVIVVLLQCCFVRNAVVLLPELALLLVLCFYYLQKSIKEGTWKEFQGLKMKEAAFCAGLCGVAIVPFVLLYYALHGVLLEYFVPCFVAAVNCGILNFVVCFGALYLVRRLRTPSVCKQKDGKKFPFPKNLKAPAEVDELMLTPNSEDELL